MKFSKMLYVKIEKGKSGSSFYLADEILDGEDGDRIGIYFLKEIKKLKTHKNTLI